MFRKKSNILKWILIFSLMASFVLPVFNSLAEDLEEECQLDKIESDCNSLSVDECRKLLEKCAAYLEEKSDLIEKDITKTQEEKKKNRTSQAMG